MGLNAMWVHGHSAVIELNNLGRSTAERIGGRQGTEIEGLRAGWGVEYRGQDNSGYWFHFAIPTQVLNDHVRAKLRRVMVLFTAGPGVTLRTVHVFDGPTAVFTQEGLAIGGANTEIVDGRNRFDLPSREVRWGVGVSVLFHFADPGSVILHAAGVDFDFGARSL